MKLGSVTKIDERNMITSKMLRMTSYRQIVVWFMATFEPSGNRFPDALPIKLIFWLTMTLYLRKLKTELKSSNAALIRLIWAMILLLPKNANFLQKNARIRKSKEVLVLKGMFFENTYVRVLTYLNFLA